MQNWTQKLNAHKPTFKTNSPEDYENCKTDFAGVASIQEYVVLGCNNCMVSFKEILMRNMSLIMFEIKFSRVAVTDSEKVWQIRPGQVSFEIN